MNGIVIKKAKELEDEIKALCEAYTDETGLLVDRIEVQRVGAAQSYRVNLLASLEPEPSSDTAEHCLH